MCISFDLVFLTKMALNSLSSFPGKSVVGTPCFHCRWPLVLLREPGSYMLCAAEKKKKDPVLSKKAGIRATAVFHI